MDTYDAVVIGGGVAGFAAACGAAEKGAKVCLIEKDQIGGPCIQRGLLLLRWILSRQGKATDHPPVDFAALVADFQATAKQASENRLSLLKEIEVAVVKGLGTLVGNGQVRVVSGDTDEMIKGGRIVLATGSLPKPIVTIPFDGIRVLPADDFSLLQKIPESLLIVGGSPMGLELAELFNRLGAKVFLVEEKPRLIPDQDPEMIEALEQSFKKQKIKTLLNKKIISTFMDESKIDITLDGGVKFSVEKMVMVGERLGNTNDAVAPGLGIEMGQNQEIWVNEEMATSLKGVYAAGSVTGRKPCPDVSEAEGKVAGGNAAGASKTLDRDQIPFRVLTTPEIASVGCLESEAHHKGFRAVAGRADLSSLDHALIHGDVAGFFKIVADRESKKIIGAQFLGPRASELLALVLVAMRKGNSASALAQISPGWGAGTEGVQKAAQACVRAGSGRR